MTHIKQYEQYYNTQRPKFKIGDKVYATNILDITHWLIDMNINPSYSIKPDTKYTINDCQTIANEIYYELKEMPKPNNYQEYRFSTPSEYFQMKYNI